MKTILWWLIKVFRRLLCVLVYLLGSDILFLGMIIYAPLEYLFTGHVRYIKFAVNVLDRLMKYISPDK